MVEDASPWAEIDKRLEGAPIEADGVTVQPVGRLTGRWVRAGDDRGGGSVIFGKLEPIEVIARQQGEEQVVPTPAPSSEPLRGIVMAGIALSAGCVAIMVLARFLVRRVANRSALRQAREVG